MMRKLKLIGMVAMVWGAGFGGSCAFGGGGSTNMSVEELVMEEEIRLVESRDADLRAERDEGRRRELAYAHDFIPEKIRKELLRIGAEMDKLAEEMEEIIRQGKEENKKIEEAYKNQV